MGPPFFLTYEQAREGVLAQNPNAEAAFLMVNPDHPSQPNGRDNSVVIGMLGIDCRHYCHTELHPTYAMAIHTYNSTTDDQWKVFARNWGNEGRAGAIRFSPTYNRSAYGLDIRMPLRLRLRAAIFLVELADMITVRRR